MAIVGLVREGNLGKLLRDMGKARWKSCRSKFLTSETIESDDGEVQSGNHENPKSAYGVADSLRRNLLPVGVTRRPRHLIHLWRPVE